MCRNIRVLHHFEPPTTPEEIHAAAEQFVRKVSGLRAPTKADEPAFERAIEAVAKITTRLLDDLPERGAARTREGEREKAKARWESRATRIAASHPRPAAKRPAPKRRSSTR
jgi:hypothetical protein